ncbi:hypothetical protein BH10ACT11_BH10ACT11_20820 [soil metagenome]
MSMSAFRIDRLLPAACFLAAAVLFASELMTMFDFTPPGGETLQTQSAHARHGNAMFVISVFAILALFVAVSTGSKPAALGVAVMGGIALLVFLINDLPDAGQVGTLNDVRQSYFDAEAVPQAGFWLEMVSAIGLAISGTALATLSPEQLMALRSKPEKQVADMEAGKKTEKAAKKPAPNGNDAKDATASSSAKKTPAPKGTSS